MKNEQKQQIKARFWGNYIGCKYQYINPDFQKMTPAIFTNCGLIKDDSNYRVRNENGFNKQAFEDCKLILRPLSSITDTEAVEVFSLAMGEDSVQISVHRFQLADNFVIDVFLSEYGLLGRFEYKTLTFTKESNCDYSDIIAYDKFRSQGFCLPFMGIDPIEENWAVLKPETPQP